MADVSDKISLAFQFVASFSWAIGAGLAGPADAADFLQFAAALAWCVANIASLYSMGIEAKVSTPPLRTESTRNLLKTSSTVSNGDEAPKSAV